MALAIYMKQSSILIVKSLFADSKGTVLGALSIGENIDISQAKYRQFRKLTMQDYIQLSYERRVWNDEVKYEFKADVPLFTMSNKFAVFFACQLSTTPTDIMFSNYEQIVFAVDNSLFKQVYETKGIEFAHNDDNQFEEYVDAAKHRYHNITLTLTSPFMNNLSTKIYTGMTDGVHMFKQMGAIPSSTHFPVSIEDKDGNDVDLNYLSKVYDQIIVEIDYVFGHLN